MSPERGGAGTKEPPTNAGQPSFVSGLGEFGSLLDEFAGAVEEELGLSGQQERQAVAKVLRGSLAAQSGGVQEMFREVFTDLPGDGKLKVEQFWRMSGAQLSISGARAAIRDKALARRSVLEWVKLILELIKKIIALILDFINVHFPLAFGLILVLTIILAILNIIDNLLHGLNQLLAGREPVDMDRLSRSMWEGLEVYWKAQAAFLGSSALDMETATE
jgi:hypothetical protein